MRFIILAIVLAFPLARPLPHGASRTGAAFRCGSGWAGRWSPARLLLNERVPRIPDEDRRGAARGATGAARTARQRTPRAREPACWYVARHRRATSLRWCCSRSAQCGRAHEPLAAGSGTRRAPEFDAIDGS